MISFFHGGYYFDNLAYGRAPLYCSGIDRNASRSDLGSNARQRRFIKSEFAQFHVVIQWEISEGFSQDAVYQLPSTYR